MVTVLTLVMIGGFITIITLLVIRFSDVFGQDRVAEVLGIPDNITLPAGTVPLSFTATDTWYAVVTDANDILIFDRSRGDLIQTLTVTAP